MIKYENHCCGCAAPGYPCIGSSCPYVNVPVYYCDFCDIDNYAVCDIENEHYCEEHAKAYLKEIFEDLSLLEQGEILDINIKSLED